MRKKLKDMNDAEKVEQVANLVCEFYESKKRPSRLLRSVIRHTGKDMYLTQSVKKLKILETERRKALRKNKKSNTSAADKIQQSQKVYNLYKTQMYSVFLNAIMCIYQ